MFIRERGLFFTYPTTLPRLWEAEHIQEACPPCEMLFSKLERTGKNGKLTQDVRVQERGEPKSGTGIIYSWTTAALINTYDYLQGLFGEEAPLQLCSNGAHVISCSHQSARHVALACHTV